MSCTCIYMYIDDNHCHHVYYFFLPLLSGKNMQEGGTHNEGIIIDT